MYTKPLDPWLKQIKFLPAHLVNSGSIRESTDRIKYAHLCNAGQLHGWHSMLLSGCPGRGKWVTTCSLWPCGCPDSNLCKYYLWRTPNELHRSVLNRLIYIHGPTHTQVVLTIFKNWWQLRQHPTSWLGQQEARASIRFKWKGSNMVSGNMTIPLSHS